MTRDQIIETMARAKCDWEGCEPDEVYPATGKPFWRCYESEAARDIAALESAGLAVVPVEPTPVMQDDIWLAAQLQNANAQYAAMIAAGQGAHKP